MNKFVIISFAFLGFVFWELSGGSDFEPKTRAQVAEKKAPTHVDDAPVPARASLSVPIVQASATPRETEGAAMPVMMSVDTADLPATDTSRAAQPVVVASLVTGLQSFTTPGAPVLLKPTVTDAPAQDSLALVLETQNPTDLRRVRGSRVNMRGGPGTSYAVLMVLPRDREVEVLRENGSGWVKLKDSDTGRIGWMASKMLVASN
ncbi:MAG: SH3 domain-containing protein [Shimia sp.]|nr:SH3 domain-containing protein [Shimia sp.]MCP4824496.1 SH3 domain-containing protein [Shimia sp.]